MSRIKHAEKSPEGHEDIEDCRDDEASLLGRGTRQTNSSIAFYILIFILTVSVLTNLALILHPNEDVSRYGSSGISQNFVKVDAYANSQLEIRANSHNQ